MTSSTPPDDPHDIDGNTPLHRAAGQACLAEVRALLAAGGNPSALNQQSETPLHLAVRAITNYPPADTWLGGIELLLQAGTKPNARNLKLQTPLHLLRLYQHHYQSVQTQLALLDELEPLLIAYGARPDLILPGIASE